MKKLAIIDLLFNWPPDGGARIDVKEVATRLCRDFHVTLFVPDFPLLCRRGDIQETFEQLKQVILNIHDGRSQWDSTNVGLIQRT